jgi:cell division protein FtsN
MPSRDPFDRDSLEDREILDIIPERYDSDPDSRQARRAAYTRLTLTVSLVVLAVMALGIAAKHILFGEAPKDHQMSAPVIHADDKPIKVKPQDRGGMDVPNQDKLIYDRMAAKNGDQQPERLLPPPEQAQTPPANESAPAPGPAPGPAPAPTPTPSMTAPAPAMTAALPPKTSQSPAASAPMPAPAPKPAPAPAPAPQPAAKPAPAPALVPAAAPAAKAGGGWVVQLGSLGSEAEAKSEWARIKGAHSELANLSPDIERVDLGAKGVHWRVRGGFLDEAQARVLCAELSKQGQGCIVAKK